MALASLTSPLLRDTVRTMWIGPRPTDGDRLHREEAVVVIGLRERLEASAERMDEALTELRGLVGDQSTPQTTPALPSFFLR